MFGASTSGGPESEGLYNMAGETRSINVVYTFRNCTECLRCTASKGNKNWKLLV